MLSHLLAFANSTLGIVVAYVAASLALVIVVVVRCRALWLTSRSQPQPDTEPTDARRRPPHVGGFLMWD